MALEEYAFQEKIKLLVLLLSKYDMDRSRGGGVQGSGKSQVAIGFHGKSGTNPPREAILPFRSNCFSRELCTALSEIH